MTLISERPLRVAVPVLGSHPSSYVVRDFVQSLARAGVDSFTLPRRIGSVLARTRLSAPRSSRQLVLVPLMGPRFDTLAAASLFGLPIPFCWDVWEPQWERWAEYLERSRPPLVITTAQASARHLAAALTDSVVVHLPEAIHLGRYSSGTALSARAIDVLEMGRRHAPWHDAVTRADQIPHIRHLYERAQGEVIFAGEAALVAGLADSKISVCFPSSLTHPERSGSVSTLTSRYLESMASRCLILGQTPDELSDLIGFDPGVRADLQRPGLQLESVLGSIDSHQPRVDEAYQRVQSVGGWDYRVQQILEVIRSL